jgi:hypothetical protein
LAITRIILQIDIIKIFPDDARNEITKIKAGKYLEYINQFKE